MARREGIFKRGRFWHVRKDPITGQQRSTGCTDKEAARRWVAVRQRDAADPAHAAARTATLGSWCGRLVALKERERSAATVEIYRAKLGHWIRILGRDATLSSVTTETVDQFVMRRRGEGVSESTIDKEVRALIVVLKLAKRARAYGGDLDVLRPPDLHATYVPRTRALSREEVVRLLAALPPERGAFVALCVALGLRTSEAFRILPSDVKAGLVFIGGTKTDQSRRWLPILRPFRWLLEQAVPHLPLRPWHKGDIIRDIKAACRRAGIEPCSPNDFRRSHATLLVEAGVPPSVVARLLGHTTARMVERVYGQPSPEAIGELAEGYLAGALPIAPGQERDSDQACDGDSRWAGQGSNLRHPACKSLADPRQDSPKRNSAGHTGLAEADATHRPPRRSTPTRHTPAAWALAAAAHAMGVLG